MLNYQRVAELYFSPKKMQNMWTSASIWGLRVGGFSKMAVASLEIDMYVYSMVPPQLRLLVYKPHWPVRDI